MDEIQFLVDQMQYLVLHAPRQTGKTSALLALADRLNRSGRYRCVYVNFEAGQAAREDTERAMRALLGRLGTRARESLGDDYVERVAPAMLERYGPDGALGELLVQWSKRSSKPLVLLIDEIDSLVGDTLVSILRQLRSEYDMRPERFPQSVVLCGVRDVCECGVHTSSEGIVLGGSAFKVKAAALWLGDFSESEVRSLLGQHVAETGQEFTDRALAEVWNITRGQPWLVNALAYDCCFRDTAARARRSPIRLEDIQQARERLISRRDTHIDNLVERLKEPRVRRVVEPLLSCIDGGEMKLDHDDLEYVRDLGLITLQDMPRIANPIYREVVPRALTRHVQLTLNERSAWYVGTDGRLRVGKLLASFQEFFRQGSEHWLGRFDYKEAGPQLLLQAFLQRIVNSGGHVEREYGLGRLRTDLLVAWRGPDAKGDPHGWDKVVIECKLRHGSVETTIRKGIEQTAEYMERAGTEAGHLVIFDRSKGATWDEKIFRREETAGGKQVTVWGM